MRRNARALTARRIVAVITLLGIILDPPQRLSCACAAAEPLRGVLHLRVGDPADPYRRNLRLDRPGVLPLKIGDRFWIEARLNRPAYLYLFWVGSDGKVAPIYPWQPGHWETRPTAEQKRDRLDLPADTKAAWEIPTGSPGLETLLLLVREDSPLPRKDEQTIARHLAGARASTDILIKETVWLENGREITIDHQDRAAPSSKTRKSDDPVLRIRRLLNEKVQPLAQRSCLGVQAGSEVRNYRERFAATVTPAVSGPGPILFL